MPLDTNIENINQEDIDKAKELLDTHRRLKKIMGSERESSEQIKNNTSKTNDSVSDTVAKKEEISELNKKIADSELTIGSIIEDESKALSDVVDKKGQILNTNYAIMDTEEHIVSQSESGLNISKDTVESKTEHLAILSKTAKEQEKILAFSSNILNNIKEVVSEQEKLNNKLSETNEFEDDIDSEYDKRKRKKNDEYSDADNKTYDRHKKLRLALNTILNEFEKRLKGGIDKWIEIDQRIYATGRTMGMTTSQLRGMQKNVLENYGEIANKLGMTFEEIFKFQDAYQQSVGRSVILTNKEVESLASLSKFVGEDAVNEMSKNMDIFGASSSSAIDYLTLNMARAANQGLNLSETGKKFAQNIKMATQYTFSKGVDGISKMTLLSQRLKFNMESIGNAIDKFSDIEGAISTSANIQVLGGAYAANFANPMQAMGEALLDAEGFTKRIVDTVAQSAVFNTRSGMVEMSPIEKAKMKELSKSLGISYDELWNMASQQAKIGEIDKYTRGKNFNEEEKAFLANTAQYDAATGKWNITRMNENGEQEQVDINTLSSEDITKIQQQNDVEKAMQGDVHAIRSKLDDYLGKSVKDTKTLKEGIKGQEERIAINTASGIDTFMSWGKEFINSATMPQYLLVGIAGSILATLIKNKTQEKIDNIGRRDRNNARARSKGNRGSGGAKPSSPNTSSTSGGSSSASRPKAKGSKIFKGGIGRSAKRASLKLLGKAGTKAAAKAIPILGTALTIADGVYESYQAINDYQNQLSAIDSDETMTRQEKARAKYDARRNKNANVGGAIGGTGGALAGAAAGAAIGSVIPGVGTVIGGAIGGLVGWLGGNSLGKTVGEATTGSYEDSDEAKAVGDGRTPMSRIESMTSGDLSLIQTDIRAIRTNTDTIVGGNGSSYVNRFEYSNIFTPPEPLKQYSTKTYIREYTPYNQYQQTPSNKIEKIDLNISGTLKIQGDSKVQNVDINSIFQSQEFQKMLLNKINEGFSRNGNAVQTRNLDSTQSIMGGFYTPSQANGK